jgi:S1-C subfamily serine protease
MQLKITSGADAGQTVDVQGDEFTIGREAGADFVIKDGKASRRHAAIRPMPDGRATLVDLGSSNGTFVNGQQIQSQVLNGNEQIQIGDTVLVPVVGSPAAAGAGGATSIGTVPPAGAQPPTQAQPPVGAPGAAPPTGQQAAVPTGQQATPPTGQQPTPPGQQPPPPTGQPPGGFQQPSDRPVSRPSRTQSAIQRIMLQRAVTRATWVGIIAIVLAVAIGVAALLGVFSSDPPSNADIVAEAEPSTTMILTDKGDAAGRGTGWVWDAGQGLIVTNAHVVAGGQKWYVGIGEHMKIDAEAGTIKGLTPGGRPAQLLGQANCEDTAVLKAEDAGGLKTVPRGSQGELRIGDRVVAAGYPSTANLATNDTFTEPGFVSADLTASSGDVAQVETTFQSIPGEGPDDPEIGPYQNVILTTTVLNQGNSGGPLLNEDGELVGMNSAKNEENTGQNYAVGVDRIKEIVPKLLAGEDVCGDGNGALAGGAPAPAGE